MPLTDDIFPRDDIFARYVLHPALPSRAPLLPRLATGRPPLPTHLTKNTKDNKNPANAAPNSDFRCRSGYVYDSRRHGCVRRSRWNSWGRWVLLAIIVAMVFVLVALTCIRSRRQRRRGRQPMFGTGWMAPQGGKFGVPPQQQQWGGGPPQGGYPMQGQAPPPYPQEHYGPPPGQYGPPPGQEGYGAPQSPYAGYAPAETGVQQPPNAYQPSYAPPMGPPPGK